MEPIQFKKLHDDAIVPTKGTLYSAGFDLYALEDTLIVGGAGNCLVKTGIAVQLPEGTYGRIAMRSGLAIKQDLAVSAGVIDVDYTGEIGVVVFCTMPRNDEIRHGFGTYTIKKGERFAQLIPEKIACVDSITVTDFSRRYEAHAGYGSTGTGL